jgi:hypothetical protein
VNDWTVSLPEDLEPLPDRRRQRCAPSYSSVPRCSIARTGVTLSAAAVEALGAPAYIAISYGPHSRMLALAPGVRGDAKFYPATRKLEIRLLSRLGLPLPRRGRGFQFEGRMTEGGALLFGPLPGEGR